MNKNNRAFTLVEVIGVVSLLAIILLISLPTLTGSLKKNEQRKYDTYFNNLKTATEAYVVKNIDEFPQLKTVGGQAYISISTLFEEEYISQIEKDPTQDDSNQPNTVKVIVNSDGTFGYELIKR